MPLPDVPMPPKPLVRTRTMVGKYRVDRKIAEGGFGHVYLAYDTVEGVPVALKVPYRHLQGEEHREAFKRELRMVARLDHPNILTVKNADVIDGALVIAYPLGEEALDDRLQRRLSPRTALDYAHQMLRAVAWAHAHRVVHRDIKPENFVLFPEGTIKLTDFGVAHTVVRTKLASKIAGTVGYMAPEQAMGRSTSRSDVFSLGLVIYRMFAGCLPEWPFDWPPPRYDRFTSVVGPGLEKLVRRALYVDGRKRYPDAVAMLEEFEAVKPRALRGQRNVHTPADDCRFCSIPAGRSILR